jgi:hypothetical protein
LWEELGEEGVVEAGERAAAEADGADGAGGMIVGERDVGARRFFVDCHFGDEGNAHASGDHAEEAAELAAFEDDLRMEAGAVASGKRVFAEAVAVAKEQEGFSAEVFQG